MLHLLSLLIIVLYSFLLWIILVITATMVIGIHEMGHSIVAKILKQQSFNVLKHIWGKKGTKKKILGIEVFRLPKERYPQYCGNAGGMAFNDMEVYDKKTKYIILIGPLITTICLLLIGSTYTVIFKITLVESLSLPLYVYFTIVAFLIGIEKFMCAKHWRTSKSKLDKLDEIVKETIENSKNEIDTETIENSKTPDCEKCNYGKVKLPSVSDGTKLRYSTEFAEILKKIYDHKHLFCTYEDIYNCISKEIPPNEKKKGKIRLFLLHMLLSDVNFLR